MPAPIIKAMITYITQELEITTWDGEVPRYAVPGTAINQSASTTPSTWPIVQAKMDSGFAREYTFANAYTDDGDITIQLWAVQRVDVDTVLASIETLFGSYAAWQGLSTLLGGPTTDPFYIIQMELMNWTVVQEEEMRIGLSDYLYRGEMKYNVQIHGSLPYIN